jgi:hypothetical protein
MTGMPSASGAGGSDDKAKVKAVIQAGRNGFLALDRANGSSWLSPPVTWADRIKPDGRPNLFPVRTRPRRNKACPSGGGGHNWQAGHSPQTSWYYFPRKAARHTTRPIRSTARNALHRKHRDAHPLDPTGSGAGGRSGNRKTK